MKTLLPSWIDTSVVDGLEDVSGLIMVNRAIEADFLEAPLSIILPEPRATHPEVYKFVEKNLHRYHRIYTFDVELLRRSSAARKLLFGTSFINRTDIPMKPLAKAGISFLCSSKRGILGQKLRQLIYKNQSILELRTGRELSFWRSGMDELLPQVCRRGNRILGIASGAKKDLHLPFQFSIILENSQQDNYFTEKLIDCLLCKTVPIYWGCPNIGAYFDARGIIILRSIDGGIIEELVMQLKKCGPEFYEQRREAIENNYDMAFNYAFNYSERLKKLIHT